MAYNHSQLARECGQVKTPSARLLLMVLASAMGKDDHKCNWRVSTLLHYTKLSEATYKKAMNEIELAGIVTRDKRMGKSSTFIWHPNVAEELRDPVKQDWAEPSKADRENMERMDVESKESVPVSKGFEIDDSDTVPAYIDEDEEFPCSQCKVEPVIVESSRCLSCMKADRPQAKAIRKTASGLGHLIPLDRRGRGYWCTRCEHELVQIEREQLVCSR